MEEEKEVGREEKSPLLFKPSKVVVRATGSFTPPPGDKDKNPNQNKK